MYLIAIYTRCIIFTLVVTPLKYYVIMAFNLCKGLHFQEDKIEHIIPCCMLTVLIYWVKM